MEYILTDDEDFNVWLRIQRTSFAMAKLRERELQKYGISSINAAVLLQAYNMPDTITSAYVSQQLLRDPNTISELIARMEKKGLVKKVKDLPRKNLKRIALTDKGITAFHHSSKRESIHNAVSVLSKEEKRQLSIYLDKILNKIDDDLL